MSKTYGPRPQSFTLDDGERYYVGADVGQYLKYHRGTLYKRYPQLWKRLATMEEKKRIQDLGCAVSYINSNIMLVKAREVEEIFEGQEVEGIYKFSFILCHHKLLLRINIGPQEGD